jgi:lipopolysaccharide/colanic/teichoic acid biosynthesis glycosyltransferase
MESVDGVKTNIHNNEIGHFEHKPVYEAVKRVQDFIMALIAIILLLPIWALISLIIRVSSPGPIIFKQPKALGRYGKRFTMYKFRTMYFDRDDSIHREAVARFIQGDHLDTIEKGGETIPVYKLTQDPRVTPIGRILRKTGLDELPQLFNVLRGELSLVGPRPPLTYEYENYLDWHKERMEVMPGITGLYQVTARSEVPFEKMVEIDIEYIRRRSYWLDLKIMFMTPLVLITGKGAY